LKPARQLIESAGLMLVEPGLKAKKK